MSNSLTAFLAAIGLFGLVALSVPSYAQQAATVPDATDDLASSERARNAVYVELLGAGLLYSVNYDRHLIGRWHLRGGYSTLGSSFTFGDDDRAHLVPVQLAFVSDTEGALELGAGATLLLDGTNSDWSDTVLASFTIGYRNQPREQGFLFRIGFTPFVGYADRLIAAPGGGISFGYAF